MNYYELLIRRHFMQNASGGESGGGTTPEALQEFWLDSGVANVNGHYTLTSNSASEIVWQNDSTSATVTAEYSTVDKEWTWTVSSGATPCYRAISTSTDITAVQWQFAVDGVPPLPTISTTNPGESGGGGNASEPVIRIVSDNAAAGCAQTYRLTSGDTSNKPGDDSNNWVFTGETDSSWTIQIKCHEMPDDIYVYIRKDGSTRYEWSIVGSWVSLADTLSKITEVYDAPNGVNVSMTLTVEESGSGTATPQTIGG